MSKPLSDAQRDALRSLAQFWSRGRPQPWDAIRPQTREALQRAGLANGGITPRGLAELGFVGPAVTAWATQLRRAAEADARRRAHLRQWWANVPVSRPYEGPTPLLFASDLRAAADALAPLDDTAAEAQRQAAWMAEPARAEVRAAMDGAAADDVELAAGGNP